MSRNLHQYRPKSHSTNKTLLSWAQLDFKETNDFGVTDFTRKFVWTLSELCVSAANLAWSSEKPPALNHVNGLGV